MKRHKHSLSHYRLLTGKMGQLLPAGLVEVLPGDTFQHSTSLLVRTAPLNAPPMHPLNVRVHHFYLPTRVVWPNFVNFITGGSNGADATVAPTLSVNPAVGDLADYLGIPTGTAQTVSAIPFRVYGMIYNEYYRDQDLVTPLTVSTADGADVTTSTALQYVAWEKDYFTSARPWTQKGSAISLPLGTSATVKTQASVGYDGTHEGIKWRFANGTGAVNNSKLLTSANDGYAYESTSAGTAAGQPIYPGNLYADLSTATAATINQLRRAFALQKYEEARALYGSRFTEYLRYLGVKSSDGRLQRPVYLGGGKSTIQFSEVLQSAPTTSGTPTTGLGTMSGHGIGSVRSNRYKYFFEEHGFVMTLVSIQPRTMYATGLPKMWSYSTKEDYWQKELQHIGQQEIYNREVYAAHSQPSNVFGYQDRYDQYRRCESGISGLFRSTLNYWTLARLFAGDTTLNQSFIQSNPSSRIFQDQSSDHLYIMANHSIQARRLVDPKGIPGALV